MTAATSETVSVDPVSSYNLAYAASLEYFKGDELAAKVFCDKYALRDNDGVITEICPDEMHSRLADEFARVEAKYPNPISREEIYALFRFFNYVVPQGSPMSAIGNPYRIESASNCFVIESPYDSYSGILKTDQEQAQIMKRRGGVGFDISKIRPKGVVTHNAARTTDGIGIFMQRFSNTCREVAQGGRRGALMLTISCHHPEIRTFINIKRDKKKVTGANISIRLSDEFMSAVKKGEQVQLRWPVDSRDPKISEYVDARELWKEIIHSAWECAEPGLLFWDTAKKMTPADIYEEEGFGSISTNPCAELILAAGDSCRLMTVNLLPFVRKPFLKDASFDYEAFSECVIKSQRLMDDLVDLELEQIEKIISKIDHDPEPHNVKKIEMDMWKTIRRACYEGRRTGLGITALGDTLAAMNIKYGSPLSIDVVEQIYKTLAISSYKSSCILAKERGAFPVFNKEKEKGHPFLERIWKASPETYELYKKYGRRNIANLTTAPTGSVSTMTQTTSGIEPLFRMSYDRRKKINSSDMTARVDFVDDMGDKWQMFTVYHPGVKKWMEATGETDISKSPYAGATANEIDWVSSVKLQAAAQKWVCHAISRTCNLPKDASEDVVAQVYMAAYDAGCKGFTVYRDGCRDGVLVETKQNKTETTKIIKTQAPKRLADMPCAVHHEKVKGEAYFVIVGLLHGDPYEVFAGKNGVINKSVKFGVVSKLSRGNYTVVFDDGSKMDKVADHISDEEEAITRLASAALRHGADVGFIVHQLEKTRGDFQGFAKAICRALKKHVKNGTKVAGDVCVSCGSPNLVREEGCSKCADCGVSKCS